MESIPIRNPFPGARSYLMASTRSTQAEARLLAERGAAPGSLVAAEAQTEGRGRFPERRWEAEAGKNLLFTIFLEPAAAGLPGLPIRIGAALCESVIAYSRSLGTEFARPPRIKWPNDLMLGDRKAAGILCEAGASGVFAGIGLNCNQVVFPASIEARTTSLAAELGREVYRWALLEVFLGRLAASLEDGDWLRKATAMLWKLGEAAVFSPGRLGADGDQGSLPLTGVIEGLDEAGSLLFKEEGRIAARAYAAGELGRERRLS